jgi:hypothetical protein
MNSQLPRTGCIEHLERVIYTARVLLTDINCQGSDSVLTCTVLLKLYSQSLMSSTWPGRTAAMASEAWPIHPRITSPF